MLGRNNPISSFFILVFVVSRLISIVSQQRPWNPQLPPHLRHLTFTMKLRVDPTATTLASTDYGNLIRSHPAAVLYPSSVNDIAALVNSSYSSSVPFPIAARGHGHSTSGQAMTGGDGIVINMRSLGDEREGGSRVNVSTGSGFAYADVGGEQLWVEVLRETLRHGVAPRSWTDYLYLTVGGTLSNGGISGQAFRRGPQISNVYEMDVVTGKGEVVRCSREVHSDLFYSVLGGLGQFGVITRARLALDRAPQRVRWVRLLYVDFAALSKDQEFLISDQEATNGFDYVEGSLVTRESLINSWRSSFFSSQDQWRIRSLAEKHHVIYSLEVSKYYDSVSASSINQEVYSLLKGLSYAPGFVFTNDVSYFEFLNRVHEGELKLQAEGLWDVPHPWLNLFVPKSRIRDFDEGVFKGILKQNASVGPILVYPLNHNKWDEKMSTIIPDEEIFYTVGLLRSAVGEWEHLEEQNKEILRFCQDSGIAIKHYLPNYKITEEWKQHFGPKWKRFAKMKRRFDPRGILSPGQRIFSRTSSSEASAEDIWV